MSDATSPRTSAGRTAVYWFHDDRGVLLYVGITTSPRTRWAQHATEKRWWPDVYTRTIEWFDTRAEAERVEARSIRNDAPIYNLMPGISTPEVDLDGMQRVSMTHAVDRLPSLVDAAAAGTPSIIFRFRQPLAVLIGYRDMRDHASANSLKP